MMTVNAALESGWRAAAEQLARLGLRCVDPLSRAAAPPPGPRPASRL